MLRADRWVRGAVMKLRAYDNGGVTIDRYTVIPERWIRGWSQRGISGAVLWTAVAANDYPFHPLGFGQTTEAMAGRHLGKRVPFESLPVDVQRFANQVFN